MDRTSRGLVVVGVDDSSGARAALRFTLEEAARRGARVDVVAAFRLPEYTWGAGPMALTPEDAQRILGDLQEAVRMRVTALVDEVLAGAVAAPPVTVLAVGGRTGDVLVDAARSADLLVVGRRGRSGLSSALLGSVSLHCVLHAPCPVTVVHPVPAPRSERAGAAAGRSS